MPDSKGFGNKENGIVGQIKSIGKCGEAGASGFQFPERRGLWSDENQLLNENRKARTKRKPGDLNRDEKSRITVEQLVDTCRLRLGKQLDSYGPVDHENDRCETSEPGAFRWTADVSERPEGPTEEIYGCETGENHQREEAD